MRTLAMIEQGLRDQYYSEADVQETTPDLFMHECLDHRTCPKCNGPLSRRKAKGEPIKVATDGAKDKGQSWSYECRPACGWTMVRWEGDGR